MCDLWAGMYNVYELTKEGRRALRLQRGNRAVESHPKLVGL